MGQQHRQAKTDKKTKQPVKHKETKGLRQTLLDEANLISIKVTKGKDKGKYEKDNSWLNWIIVGKVDWLWSGGRRASDRLSGNALPPKARRSKGSLIFHSSFLTRMSNFDPSHLIFVFMFR